MSDHAQFTVGQDVTFETRGRGAARTLSGKVVGPSASPARVQVDVHGEIYSPFRSLTRAA